MNRLMRSIFVCSFFGMLLGACNMHGMLSEDVINDLKKEFGGKSASKEIVDFVEQVKQTYKIDIPVVVLEGCEKSQTKTGFSYENQRWSAHILLSEVSECYSHKASVDEQFCSLAHELGHVVNKDYEKSDRFAEFWGKESYTEEESSTEKYKEYMAYLQLQEIKADSFCIDLLIKENKIGLLYLLAYNFLVRDEISKRTICWPSRTKIDWLTRDHPRELDRAKLVFVALQRHGYSIYDTSHFVEEMSTEKAKKFYLDQVYKHPELKDMREGEIKLVNK